MKPGRTHYEVLGVSRTATSREIRAAYRDRARRLHPDVATSADGDEMGAVNEAWRVLRDTKTRAAYDRELRRAEAPVPTTVDDGAVDFEEEATEPGPVFTTDSIVIAALARGWPVLVLGLVVAIFVFTAYATTDDPAPVESKTDTDIAGWTVGDCLVRLPEPTPVPCGDGHDAIVAAVVADPDGCTGDASWFEADIEGAGKLCIVYDR